jgi:hypothetical protein
MTNEERAQLQMMNLAGTLIGAVLALLAAALLSGCSTIRTLPGIGAALTPAWDDATLASCWSGNNAEKRMMNLLSPAFSDGKVKERLAWQKGRGCNTVHLILCNRADGEGGGYSIYGAKMFGAIDSGWCKLAKKRIAECRGAGMAVVLWGMTDDDGGWNDQLIKDPARYMKDLKNAGLLDFCSMFVLCLEMTEERFTLAQWVAYRDAVRSVFNGKIGTHHNSERADYAQLGDVLLYQTEPGKSAAQIRTITRKALATGKPVNFFELSRNPARDLCEAAMSEGAYGCGNW